MDPAIYMLGTFAPHTLGCYLGTDGTETAAQKAHSHRQGLRMFEHYGIIPTRETVAYCPDCGEALRTMIDRARYGWRYWCANHQTRKKFSPLDGTFVMQARLRGEMSADKIVLLIDSWLDLQPLKYILTNLSIATDTAVAWYSFCRDIATAIAWHDFTPIGGAGDIVEVDETHVIRRKHNIGRMPRDVWVLRGISRTTKKIFAMVVESRDADTLLPILQNCIDGDSYICTDGWHAYEDCGLIFNGHGTINHQTNFVNPPKDEPPIWMPAGTFNDECLDRNWHGPPPTAGQQPFRIHTQTLKKSWEDFKKILKTSNNNINYINKYVGSWIYRKNILGQYGNRKEKFERFMRDIRRVYPGIGKNPMKLCYEDIMDCDCHECK